MRHLITLGWDAPRDLEVARRLADRYASEGWRCITNYVSPLHGLTFVYESD